MWQFKKGSDMVAIKEGSVLKVLKLVKLVEQHKCESVYSHNRFPPGVLPPELAVKKQMAYWAEDDTIFTKVQQATQDSSMAQCMWEVKVSADAKITPVAVLLITKKMLTVKLGEALEV